MLLSTANIHSKLGYYCGKPWLCRDQELTSLKQNKFFLFVPIIATNFCIFFVFGLGANTFPRCGKDFNNVRSGTFNSPSYPKAYAKGAHCTWKITVVRGQYVRATFSNVDIEGENATDAK